MTLFWVIIFVVSLIALVKSADWFLASAEHIGLALGVAPFFVGVIIVGVGTSLPELITGISAVFKNASEIVTANVVGSNITNILFSGGLVAALSTTGLLLNQKKLLTDIILLITATILGVFIIHDGKVNLIESSILMLSYATYIYYIIAFQEQKDQKPHHKIITFKDIVVLVASLCGLFIGARFLIDAVIALSTITHVPTGVIAILPVAFGTALPELAVTFAAMKEHKPQIAIGNIVGSNTFNILFVIGVPGLFKNLTVDPATIYPGAVVMLGSTIALFLAASTKRIPRWLGIAFCVYYLGFVVAIGSMFL